MKKIVEKHELIPFGYGRAYACETRFGHVCYPIPLNLLVYIWKSLYYCLIHTPRAWWEKPLNPDICD